MLTQTTLRRKVVAAMRTTVRRPRRRIGPFHASWLDFKLGFRMLARYPGLTLVATVSMADAIALGVLYFEAVGKFENPRLPVREPDRVISIVTWDRRAGAPDERQLYDFTVWRAEVKSIDHLGAAVGFVRNLVTDDRRAEPVAGAEMTASGFALMGTPPLLGRTFTERDEQPGAPPVVVLGYTVWTSRFGSDASVLGRTVTLGTEPATIIGVMPQGFGFPVSQRIWVPLRVDQSAAAPRTGPSVSVFGRLRSGVSMAQAAVELDTIAARLAAAHPDAYTNLAPRVTPYATPILEGGEAPFVRRLLLLVNGIFVLLLAIISANVATLVFARSATRGWEMTVRATLGATRGRIVSQLCAEALVLSGAAAVVGLTIAKVSMRWGLDLIGPDALPFWVDDSLSWTTVVYAALLTVWGAAIVGILPALRVTKINLQEALRQEGGARSTLRFGGFWTAIIVLQVAITVAFLPRAANGVFEANRFRQRADGIGADQYLAAAVQISRDERAGDPAAIEARARLRLEELERRLRAEPGVEQVTLADRLPVMDQSKFQFEVEAPAGAPVTGLRRSRRVRVSDGFFATFRTAIVAGRDFGPLDFRDSRVLIVNQSFAGYVFGGQNPVGRRIRIVRNEDGDDDRTVASENWYEIVGVVRDFGWQLPDPAEQAAMYLPHAPGAGERVNLAVRVRNPDAFAARLRQIVFDVDPDIPLTDVQSLAHAADGDARRIWALNGVAWVVSFIVLLLSATGIHALMSFAVTRRTREIGIRVALGARPARIVTGIFSRAALQIGAGVVAGSAVAALGGLGSARQVLLLLAANAVMLAVGLSACAVPLRRALRIDPTDALRAEH
jgi:predicted permease